MKYRLILTALTFVGAFAASSVNPANEASVELRRCNIQLYTVSPITQENAGNFTVEVPPQPNLDNSAETANEDSYQFSEIEPLLKFFKKDWAESPLQTYCDRELYDRIKNVLLSDIAGSYLYKICEKIEELKSVQKYIGEGRTKFDTALQELQKPQYGGMNAETYLQEIKKVCEDIKSLLLTNDGFFVDKTKKDEYIKSVENFITDLQTKRIEFVKNTEKIKDEKTKAVSFKDLRAQKRGRK